MTLETQETIISATAAAAITAIIDNLFNLASRKNDQQTLALPDVKAQAATSKALELYLRRAYTKSKTINTIAFGGQKRDLRELYIPLSINCRHRDNHSIQIAGFPDELFQHSNKILITDNAGMGKSTLMKFIQLSAIDEKKHIPVLIELRSLRASESISERIKSEISDSPELLTNETFQRLATSEKFLFLLDGFDEIPLDNREPILASIGHFIDRNPDVKIILTSRPEVALSALPQFLDYAIIKLIPEQAQALIKRYDRNGPLSKSLIKTLKGPTLSHAKDLLTNPLLVSLLYRAYSHKPTVPPKKHIFYRQVYDALYENHDLSKPATLVRQKQSGLDIEDFHSVIRVLGALTVKLGKIEYDRDELIKHIQTAITLTPKISTKPSDLLKDLVGAVPLFVKDGEMYRWSHKSIQEYFGASYICLDTKGECESKILGMLNAPDAARFFNVLDLIYDMDYATFRKTITIPFLNNFIAYYQAAYTAPTLQHFAGLVNDRKELCFIAPHAILKIKGPTKSKAGMDKFNTLVKTGLDAFEKLPGTWRADIGGIWKIPTEPEFIYFIFISVQKNTLIAQILLNKKEKFLVKQKTSPRPISMTEDSVIPVSESPSCSLNSDENFPAVNLMIAQSAIRILYNETCEYLNKAHQDDLAAKQSAMLV